MHQLARLGDFIGVIGFVPLAKTPLALPAMKKDRRSIIFCWSSTSAVTVRQSLMQAAISAWMRRCGVALALSARLTTDDLPSLSTSMM